MFFILLADPSSREATHQRQSSGVQAWYTNGAPSRNKKVRTAFSPIPSFRRMPRLEALLVLGRGGNLFDSLS